MTHPEKSYIELLRGARANYDAWLPSHTAVEEESRRSYAQYSDHWGNLAELAVRALGAGEDIREGNPQRNVVGVLHQIADIDPAGAKCLIAAGAHGSDFRIAIVVATDGSVGWSLV